jgi:hypothetical protein
MPDIVTRRTGGLAVVVGYVLVFVLFFLDPTAGLSTATDSLTSTLYFLGFPTVGIVAGLYAVLGGTFSAVGLFVVANYLAIVGIGLSLGLRSSAFVTALSVVLFALAGFAAVVSLRALWSYLQFGGRIGM